MKLLAVESSGLVASAAILDGDIIKAEYSLNTKLTHSQTLLPMIDEIVRSSGTELKELDAIAVSAGPGSFTGLRIGAATAKGLCVALDKPIIPVPTLDAMIWGAGPSDRIVVPIMDARRQQVYTKVGMADAPRAIGIEELIEELNVRGERVLFLGDGVPVYGDIIREKLRTGYEFAPAHLNRQRAAAVAALAVHLEPVPSDTFSPEYLRKSQAEREREENVG